jgi:glutamate-1-semialdehyde 2,1-aminomutase
MSMYNAKTKKSSFLYERARNFLPSGVSYGIRYFQPYPFYTERAKGSKLFDVDGNEYIDFWLGHTSLILGHSPVEVVEAVRVQIEKGTIYGTCHEQEILLAEQVVKMIPSAEMVRFSCSGTEANMYAVRLARTYTGKTEIAKFEGGWHGGYDALHVGVKPPWGVPESAGLSMGAINDTIVLPFNDLHGVEEELKKHKPAAIVVEPVQGAGGTIHAEKDFLRGLREMCDDSDILLVFDEVITGFRLAPGGGQEYYGVTPDITVLGKILGGGFPIGAICGRREIMERIDSLTYERPEFSFQGGTFSANPVTMVAGFATLKSLQDGRLINSLNNRGKEIRIKLKRIFEDNNIDAQVTGIGSLFNVHFTKEKVDNVNAVYRADKKRYAEYHLSMIEKGIFFLPTHCLNLCTQHTDEDINRFYDVTEAYAIKAR